MKYTEKWTMCLEQFQYYVYYRYFMDFYIHLTCISAEEC